MKPIGVDVGGTFTGIVFTESVTARTMDTGCTGRSVQLTVPEWCRQVQTRFLASVPVLDIWASACRIAG